MGAVCGDRVRQCRHDLDRRVGQNLGCLDRVLIERTLCFGDPEGKLCDHVGERYVEKLLAYRCHVTASLLWMGLIESEEARDAGEALGVERYGTSGGAPRVAGESGVG